MSQVLSLQDASMNMNEYQAEMRRPDAYPADLAIIYPILGLAGETGEVCEKLLLALFPEGVEWKGELADSIAVALLQMKLAGQLCEKVKKGIRDGTTPLNPEEVADLAARVKAMTNAQKSALMMEQGDTLWYEANLASDLNVPLGDIAQVNAAKVACRLFRNAIKGSGDNR